MTFLFVWQSKENLRIIATASLFWFCAIFVSEPVLHQLHVITSWICGLKGFIPLLMAIFQPLVLCKIQKTFDSNWCNILIMLTNDDRLYLKETKNVQPTNHKFAAKGFTKKSVMIYNRCALFCLSEAEAEASESHLQLCSRQPRRADLLWGRGDRGGWRGGPGVVGQYLSRCNIHCFSVCVCVFVFLDPCICSQI